MLAGLYNGKVSILNVKDKTTDLTLEKSFQAHEFVVRNFCITGDKKILWTCSDDGTIKAWNLEDDYHPIKTLKGHKGWVY